MDKQVVVTPKPIIVIHPSAAIDSVVAALEGAGYAVVVSDQPDMITAIEVYPFAPLQDILRCALTAIIGAQYDSVRAHFGRLVADALIRANAAAVPERKGKKSA